MKKELKEQTNRIKSMMEQIDDVSHRAFSNVETKEQYWDDDRGDAEDFERESLRNDDEGEREYFDDPENVDDKMEGLRDDLKPLVGNIPEEIEKFIVAIREASPSPNLGIGPVKIYFQTIVDHYFNQFE